MSLGQCRTMKRRRFTRTSRMGNDLRGQPLKDTEVQNVGGRSVEPDIGVLLTYERGELYIKHRRGIDRA